MAEPEPTIKVFTVTLDICELCLSGAGGHCHVPGCAFWMKRAPDGPIWAIKGAAVPP